MKTISKSSIFKPKVLTSIIAGEHQVLPTVSTALFDPKWKMAMGCEYYALLGNNTWNLVPPHPDQTLVHSKWIFRTKFKADGSLNKYKARLVAKGFQQTPGVNYFDTFYPVIKPTTIRIIFTLAVNYN